MNGLADNPEARSAIPRDRKMAVCKRRRARDSVHFARSSLETAFLHGQSNIYTFFCGSRCLLDVFKYAAAAREYWLDLLGMWKWKDDVGVVWADVQVESCVSKGTSLAVF